LGGRDWTKNEPRQLGGLCMLENESGGKNEKEEKIKDGLQGMFGPKSDRAAEQNRKLFLNLIQGNGIQTKSFEYFQTQI
jgi:hypothetical protein